MYVCTCMSWHQMHTICTYVTYVCVYICARILSLHEVPFIPYIHICMYVSLSMHTVCILYIYIYIRTYKHIYIYMYVCMNVYILYVYAYTPLPAH